MMSRNEKIAVGLGLAGTAGLAYLLSRRRVISRAYYQVQQPPEGIGPWWDPSDADSSIPKVEGTIVVVYNASEAAKYNPCYRWYVYANGQWCWVDLNPIPVRPD